MGTSAYLVEAEGRERSQSHMALYMRDFRRARRASCVCFGRGPSNHQGGRGEGGDPGVKSKGWGPSLRGFVHGFLGREKKN